MILMDMTGQTYGAEHKWTTYKKFCVYDGWEWILKKCKEMRRNVNGYKRMLTDVNECKRMQMQLDLIEIGCDGM